ncbi:nucleoside/nucleotide kinase family protein [Intrasporangium flavum]|uniref:nucleoside/nucleotide kinase family protein n=1 Tax=Intrasporangium flavum TaxID=1428657 RepID=UPI001F61E5C7|nr:nucleoside/nucleotide kinase family protein [Intrasporangium flavum]
MDGIVDLAAAAVGLVGDRRRAVLGIAGAPGAGKSTLAEALVAEVARTHGAEWVAHVPMDGFHLADAQLERLGALSRKGAPDTFDADGYAALLRRLVAEPDSWVYAPGFERTLEQPIAAAMVVPPEARVVVTEGNYLLLPEARWEAARAATDAVWFVTGDDDVRRARLVSRHVTFGKEPEAAALWVEDTDEANARRVAESAHRADRLVVNGPAGWHLAP